MKSSTKTSFCLITLCLLAGCVGFRFGPGFSMNDKEYFMEPPCVVVRTNAYSLSWRYGGLGFFFQPSSKVVDGQLQFALQATSSSFHLTGRQGEVLITDPKKIHALERGGAWWLEPDGHKVRLKTASAD